MTSDELQPIIDLLDRQNQEINRRIEDSAKRTDSRMAEMAGAIKEMSSAIINQGERHIAVEEKIIAQNSNIQRLDQNQREMGIRMDATFDKNDERFRNIESDLVLNNTTRKAAFWLVGTIVTAAIGGGIFFSF